MVVFVDAVHYIALMVDSDDLHDRALSTANGLTDVEFVTSDLILVEVLAYAARRGAHAREQAVALVDRLRSDPRTTVLPQTREMFDAGLALYRRRLDKGYSLTDCMSMAVCREMEIEDVLTHDVHFAQEGFGMLL